MITAMKKILLLAAAAIMAAGALQAKTADELRVYITPGHGSGGPNDRPMATVPYPMLPETGRPDTCGFYESNTNLWKCLKMGATLQKMGVKKENIMYSRVENGPFPYVSGAADAEKYNRNLTEIAREVDANNMDVFVSIHSNAATEGTTTNYPLFLYRGQDYTKADFEENPGSSALCLKVWESYYMDEIDPLSYYSRTSKNVRGDWDFYGSTSTTTTDKGTFKGYLGVLRQGTTGFLVEGYFHTYQPARHRALNSDYCGQEGVRCARGLCDYYGLNAETTGYIMGTVKDAHEKFTHTYYKYTPNSVDQWSPINGAVVKLKKDGKEVATYTVDQNYNGVFVFEGLAPGMYELVASHPDFKEQGNYSNVSDKNVIAWIEESMGQYEVKANATTYPHLFLEGANYVPPQVDYETYPDPVKSEMFQGVAGEYNLNTIAENAAVEVLQGKTVRRSLYRDGFQYVLALESDNTPHVYKINSKTQAVEKELSTEGTQGSVLALSDIALTSDGYLVGVNKTATAYGGGLYMRVYKWAADLEGAPVEWFNSPLSGNWTSATNGQTMTYIGSTREGKLITTAVTSGTSKAARFLIFSIIDNEMSSCIRNQNNVYSETNYGENFSLMASPRSDEHFIFDGPLKPAIELGIAGDVQSPTVIGEMSTELLPAESNNPNFFKFAGASLMVAPIVNEGLVSGVDVFDITEGLSDARLVKTYANPNANAPGKIQFKGMEFAYTTAGGQAFVKTDNDNNIIDAGFELNLIADASNSLYTTDGINQPEQRGDFAYDLSFEETKDTYTFKFKTTRIVEDVYIVLKPVDGEGEDQIVVVGRALPDGNDSTINKIEYPTGKYNWEVVVPNEAISAVSKFYAYKPTGAGNGTYCSRGMAIDRNPESPYFQMMYYSQPYGSLKGIYEIYPDLLPVNDGNPLFPNEWASSTASPFRLGVHPSGNVFIADWSDPHSGMFIYDPANKQSLSQLFAGTRNGDGVFTYNGVKTGGSTTGVSFVGEGEDLKFITFNEDIEGGNQLTLYNLGEKMVIETAPDVVYPNISAKLANTNVNIQARENGMWISQVRGTGNNTKGVPAFMYVDYEDNIIFNSADLEDLNGNYGAGLAVSDDNSMLAVASGDPYIRIYDINWEGNTPSFSFKYQIPDKYAIMNQMQFDHAGNLFAIDATHGAVGYSIPKEAQEVVTPAKLAYVLDTKVLTAVEDVNANKTVKSVKYYNTVGIASENPFEGVNIVVTTYTDGTQSSVKVIK